MTIPLYAMRWGSGLSGNRTDCGV